MMLIFESNVNIENQLGVSGTAWINQLNVTTNTIIDGTLQVQDNAIFEQDVGISGVLYVDTIDVQNNLIVNGNTTLQNLDATTACFSDNVKMEGDLGVSGVAYIDDADIGNALVQEDLTVCGDLKVKGETELDGSVIMNDGLTITNGGLGVTGDSLFNNQVEIEEELIVNQDATFNQDIIMPNGTAFLNQAQIDFLTVLNGIGTMSELTVTGQLGVTGQTWVSTIEGFFADFDDIFVSRDVLIGRDLGVTGDSTFVGDVEICGELTVKGNSEFQSDIGVSGVAYLNDVDADDILITNELTVDGNAEFRSDIGVSGVAYINDLDVDDVLINNNLTVKNNSTFENDIGVSGVAYINDLDVDDVLINNNLTVKNNSTFENDIGVSGVAYIDDANIEDVLINNTLTVDGDATFNNDVFVFGTITGENGLQVIGGMGVTGDVELYDNLTVEEDVTICGDLMIKGGIIAEDGLSITGDVDLFNNVTIYQDLGVSGTTYLNDVVIEGDLNVGGDGDGINFIDVGVTICGGNVTICDDLGVSGVSYLDTLSVENNTEICGDLVVKGDFFLDGEILPVVADPVCCVIFDQKPNGTNGGAFTANTWTIRDLNTIEGMTSGKVTLNAGNTFTIQPGTYHILIKSPANIVRDHATRLWDVTNNTVEKYSGSSDTGDDTGQTTSIIMHCLSITEATTYRVEHIGEVTVGTAGLGDAVDIPNYTGPEIYTQIKIWESSPRGPQGPKGDTGSTTFDGISGGVGDLIVGDGVGTFSNLPVGTDGQILVADSGEATGMRWTDSGIGNVARIWDQKPNNTPGGTFNSGSWQERDLNQLQQTGSFVTSLAGNEFTLTAGTYKFEFDVPAYQVEENKARLFNVTDGTVEAYGTSAFADDGGDDGTTYSFIKAIVTIATPKTFRIEHQCQTSEAGDGFGIESNFGVVEIYTSGFITRVL